MADENNEIRVQYMSLDWWRYLPTSLGMPSTRNKGIRVVSSHGG